MIYVASSWRNALQPLVVEDLRKAGYEVYDFRHPAPGDDGFHWSEIDPEWRSWSPGQFRAALEHPIAQEGYRRDMTAMVDSDIFVLVCPAGRSAHLEVGWACGAGKKAIALLLEGEPELMYRMIHKTVLSIEELIEELRWCGRLW